MNPNKRMGKKTLISLVSVAAASLLTMLVPKFEGVVLKGYFDPVGIPTKCAGDTTNVEIGKVYTHAECKESLETQLIKHAEPVLKCTPILKNKPNQLAAAVSFAYNIGVGAYCRSDTAARFNAGDFAGACKAMNENDEAGQQWVTARGRVLNGLVRRRAEERALCEKDLK